MARADGSQSVPMPGGRHSRRIETSNPELGAVVPKRVGRLLRTPMPLERESLLPYALRLSEANGYLTPGYFLTAPTSQQFQVSRYMMAALIRESAGLDEEQMARLVYASVDDDSTTGRLLGQRVGLYDLQLRAPKICPACVDENGFIEALWDLAWVTACPVHARKLLDICPVCTSRFTWSRPGIAKCPQGHDVSKFICADASREEVDIACFLARKLYGEEAAGYPKKATPSHLAAMPLYETCRLAAKLTNCQAKRASATNRTIRGRRNLLSHAGDMTSLHALLCGTPHDREIFFEAMSIDAATGARFRSFHAAFHWLLSLFSKEHAVEIMSPLLAELFTFAAEHWPPSRMGRTAALFRPFLIPSKWTSVTAAAKRIGVYHFKITQGIARGDVPHKQVSDRSNHNMVVPVAWVEEQASVPRNPMRRTGLRNLFSLNIPVVESLREKRVFIPSIKASPKQILKHDIMLLAERLIRFSPGTVGSASASEVTFRDLMYRRSSDETKAAVVMAILDESLRPTGNVIGQMLPGLLFDKMEARRFCTSQDTLLSDEVQLGDVARLLNCHNVMALLETGHLKISRRHGARTFVAKESIEIFSASYIGAREVLAEGGVVISKLIKVAKLAGIQLLSVPDTHRDGRIWFIPRAEKDALLSAIPRFRDCNSPRANWASEKRRVALVQERAKNRRGAGEDR